MKTKEMIEEQLLYLRTNDLLYLLNEPRTEENKEEIIKTLAEIEALEWVLTPPKDVNIA